MQTETPWAPERASRAFVFSGFAWGAVDQAPQVCGELRLPALQVEEVGPQDPTGRIVGKDLHRNGLRLQLEEELLPELAESSAASTALAASP